MHSKSLVPGIFIAIFLTFSISQSQEKFFIADRDVVLFWGNSITDDGIYPRLVENYVLTHYPDWKVEFFNLGWGGDRTRNVDRLRRDIMLCQPTKVTVMLGMNDGDYKPFAPEVLEAYLKGMKDEVEVMKKHSNPEILLISATPWEMRCTPAISTGKVKDFTDLKLLFYPETLRRLSYELGKFASAHGLRFCDLNFASAQTIAELDEYDGNYMFTKEGVHPNIDGELEMGLAILENMQAPALVAESEICGKEVKVLSVVDCSVTDLKKTSVGLSFSRKAARLPLPVYPSTRGLMKEVLHYPDNWDRDILRVKNLDPGWYRLAIDGSEIDILSHRQLEAGVNLSWYANTPQVIQAYKVFEQTQVRQQAFYTKWRRVLLAGIGSPSDFTPFKTGVSTDSLDRIERAAFEAQHLLNKPAAHVYELKPAANPAAKTNQTVLANRFLENMVRVAISIDSRTLFEFKPPLCIRGNFTYAPQYEWANLETKNYYADIPVALYDDGTHGDLKAGDGVWSIEMFLRRNSGKLRFIVRDGRFVSSYWNTLHPEYFNNPWCVQLTKAWGEMLGYVDKDGEIQGIPLDKDFDLRWDMKSLERALAEKKIYQP